MEKINFEDLPSTDTPIDSANLNLLQTNVENAINEVAESGSNYVKFKSGIMVVYGSIEADANFTTWGSAYQQELSGGYFAVPFIETPFLVLASTINVDNTYNYASFAGTFGTTKSITGIIKLMRPVAASTGKVKVNYMAVGKWK